MTGTLLVVGAAVLIVGAQRDCAILSMGGLAMMLCAIPIAMLEG